jgi:hypothetical protein
MINIGDVLKIFPSSKIVAEPDISETDWFAIQGEAAHWRWDENDEKWIERFESPPDSFQCWYCVKSAARRIARGETVPKWRRYGKIIEREGWPDGSVDLGCSFCGRKHAGKESE